AAAGETVGAALRGIARNEVSRGDVLGPVDDPPVEVDSLVVRVALAAQIGTAALEWTPPRHCHTASVPVRLAEVLARIDPTSGEEEGATRPSLAEGDVARVRFVPLKPVVVEGA